MEGVGARLGRSSSRYGTTTVFSGPVRRWKKNWVPITPPPSSSSSSSAASSSLNNINSNHHHSNSNGSLNGNNNGSVSHLRLYKWTPLSKDSNNNSNKSKKVNSSDSPSNSNSPSKDEDDVVSGEPPRRKFKFVPIAVLEEQKKEIEEGSEDEAKPIDADEDDEEQVSKSEGNDEKPDINDVPMEENQESEENQTPPARQDLNELDLSLGLTSHDEEHDSDSKPHPNEDGRPESERA